MGVKNFFIACLLLVFLGANAAYETELSASSDSLQDEVKMIELEGVRLYADRVNFMKKIQQGRKFDVQLKFQKKRIKSLQLSARDLLKWAGDSGTSKRKNGYVTLPLHWHMNLDEWEKDREKELECTVRMTRKIGVLRPRAVATAKFTFDDFQRGWIRRRNRQAHQGDGAHEWKIPQDVLSRGRLHDYRRQSN